MSWYRVLFHRRFWISALTVVVTMALLCALGAWIVVRGWLPPMWSRWWMLGSWCAGALAGGRLLTGGRGGGLMQILLLCLMVYTAVVLAALTDGGLEASLWWQVAAALLMGGCLSALPWPQTKRRRQNRNTGGRHSRK